ncbi:hypothetical protein THAOC_08981 [Thalassiosira oceanica]|uniref:Uncharacterized protein n=1 Tax=Thalassiosira oceanica TaxID=159749 RepID=K0RYF8_THAOC|nr:hypothetical protein THAOC_21035 [Thalassiosira oceanica]EJK69729.1 hypothetical protein THAOC_08981 [Thalassiosira oceanica]|eukprot:EJK58808.1 hypothetical protein THAOC_21035 [Thalassiosira oceanica]
MLLMLTRIVVAFAATIGQIVVALTARITATDGGAAVPDRRGAGTKNRRSKERRARAGAARKSRLSTAALLVAVWCVASADTTAVPGPSACMAGQEHCGFETKAAPDPSPGIITPDEMFTSAAALEQISRTYRLLSQEQEQEWRVKTDDWYEEAARLFALSDGNIPAARRRSLLSTLKVDQHEESLINSEFYRIVHLIKLDETDEKNLLWMLSYIDPSVLERLISGDVPDLKSMQPRAAVDGFVVSILCVIAFGCLLFLMRSGSVSGIVDMVALCSAISLNRSETVTRNGKEGGKDGLRMRGGGKMKRRREP